MSPEDPCRDAAKNPQNLLNGMKENNLCSDRLLLAQRYMNKIIETLIILLVKVLRLEIQYLYYCDLILKTSYDIKMPVLVFRRHDFDGIAN